MKWKIGRICCLAVLLSLLLQLGTGFCQYASTAARLSGASATGQIQKDLKSTLNLLEAISQESWMLPESISYQEKATKLERYNDIWNYRMIRVVDISGGVYRGDHEEAVSNLNSRDYIQTLWITNKPQITDVFLAGADGTTLNYTVAVAIAGDAKTNGATFAAIDDNEIRAILSAQPMHTILLGKKQQCMSGNDETLIGVTLETRLTEGKLIGCSLEETLLKVKNEKNGTFWILDGIMPTCYAFYNVGLDSGWTVLTSASFADVAGDLMPATVLAFIGIVLSLAAFILLRKEDVQND